MVQLPFSDVTGSAGTFLSASCPTSILFFFFFFFGRDAPLNFTAVWPGQNYKWDRELKIGMDYTGFRKSLSLSLSLSPSPFVVLFPEKISSWSPKGGSSGSREIPCGEIYLL